MGDCANVFAIENATRIHSQTQIIQLGAKTQMHHGHVAMLSLSLQQCCL